MNTFDNNKQYCIMVRQYSIFHNNTIPMLYILQQGVDPLHMLGELHYRTLEKIEYAHIKELTPSTIDYCKEKNVPIFNLNKKY